MSALSLIYPDWPAPGNVRAVVSTRAGGVSQSPYDELNLAAHVGDDPAAVRANRARLRTSLALPAEPTWLNQVHGTTIVEATGNTLVPEADGSYASRPGRVCAVLTADCLPVLLCNRAGTLVAALHAGWRGLAGGVIEAGVQALAVPGRELIAWLGPAIGPDRFEVGAEVRTDFVRKNVRATEAFRPGSAGKYVADLYELARQRLLGCGVTAVFGGGYCTFSDPARFYSYRRDAATGRMASLIWMVDG